MNWVIHNGKRVLRISAGVVLLVVGLVLTIPGVPGPGLVVVFLGLSVLAIDFLWARRLKDGIKNSAKRTVDKVRNHRGRDLDNKPRAG